MLAGNALDARLPGAAGPMMRRVQGVRCSWLMGCLHSKTTTGRFGSKFSLSGLVLVAALALPADCRHREMAQTSEAIPQPRLPRERVLLDDGANLRNCDNILCSAGFGGTCLTTACD